jgi:hypothetical protein
MIGLAGLDFDRKVQLLLFEPNYNKGKLLEPLMQAFDSINERYGWGTIQLGCGIRKLGMRNEERKKRNEEGNVSEPWEMKREYLSPRYTTSIKDIPIAL